MLNMEKNLSDLSPRSAVPKFFWLIILTDSSSKRSLAFIPYSYLAVSEVDILGDPTSLRSHFYIQGFFSLGPNEILNWYFDGHKVDNPNSKSDGLYTVLQIDPQRGLHGTYSLRIDDTKIVDDITIPGK